MLHYWVHKLLIHLDKSKEICDKCDVPIAVIPMMDYGMLDGKKVLDLALSLISG